MAEVATAYVSLLPSFRGGRKAIAKELTRAGSAAGDQAGREAGRRFGSSFVLPLRGLIGPVFGAIGAAAVGMGLKTAAGIEQAEVAFRTLLGSGEEARDFIDDLYKFAKTTPFELPGLIDAARQLLGVGHSAEDVIPTLRAWGDAAGALGLNQEAFNRVLLAVTQSMAKGKIQAEELMQITEAGIPIWPLLSRALGKPIPVLQELISEGKLAAEDVFPALERQMAKDYGGAMAEQSQTLEGLWSSLMDTINIGMAQTLEPLVPFLKQTLSGAIDFLGQVFEKLPGIIEEVGPKIRGFINWVTDTAVPAVVGFGTALINRFIPVEDVKKNLDEISKFLSDFWDGLTGSSAPPPDVITDHIFVPSEGTQLGQRLRALFEGGLSDAISGIDWQSVGEKIGSALGSAIKISAEALSGILESIREWAANVDWVEVGETVGRTAIPFAIGFITSLFDGLTDPQFWQEHWDEFLFALISIVPVGRIAGVFAKIFGRIPIVGPILNLLNRVGGAVETGFRKVLGVVGRFLGETGRAFMEGFRRIFPDAGKRFGQFLSNLGTRISNTIPTIKRKAKELVQGLINGIKEKYRDVVSALGELVGRITRRFQNAGRWLVGRGKEVVGGLLRGVRERASEIGSWFKRTVIDKVTGAFKKARDWLVESGKKIIQGLIDGIQQKAKDVTSAVSDVVERARNLLPFSPAKEGPFSGRGWTLYSGRSIAEDLARGISQRSGLVDDAMRNMLTMPPAPLGLAGAGAPFIGGDTYVTVILDGEPIRAVVRREVAEHDRVTRRSALAGTRRLV